ncbi:hypothetical protein [Glutamicibacter sp. PS]|uniref:hypothetical protein n=1 Tax=Glutamicibacter sp. PS TaxID=3075634 RepID=UPI002842F1A2|nr:hypothetical protein [Glutamicibacter sp. PS]MDR4532531.1 hypothetical protein [Glutamicibacter sp. PS]
MKLTLSISRWAMFGCFAVSLVIWLGFGARDEFGASEEPYSARVYVAGWLALAGVLSATVLAVTFYARFITRAATRAATRQLRRRR